MDSLEGNKIKLESFSSSIFTNIDNICQKEKKYNNFHFHCYFPFLTINYCLRPFLFFITIRIPIRLNTIHIRLSIHSDFEFDV